MPAARSTARFYADLPAFRDFAEFSDLAAYAPLPDDWTVLASDVAGSTEAIAAGRYKAVNMAGAATIMAALNAVADATADLEADIGGQVDAPYVFGGDGALVAVPAEAAEAGKEALARTAGRARDAYGLELRVAAFPVAELRAAGGDIRVRKFALGEGARLAMFAGPGVALSDRLLKDPTAGERYLIPPSDDPPDLEGLTCRWEPLRPARGVMATLMAAGLGPEGAAALAALRLRIQAVLGGDETAAAPASAAALSFRWPPTGLRLEALARAGRRRFWAAYFGALLQSLAQLWAERRQSRIGPYDAPKYRQEMLAQTDFRKFDGMLRMVLDVTPAQAEALRGALEEARRAGRVAYGLHLADAALMTCLVFDLAAADHVHFVDGADGGFALAARQLKAQLAQRA